MWKRSVLSLCLILAACTGKYKPPADTLVVALGSQPSTLDPRFATDANGMRVGGLIFESLVHVGPGFKPEGEAAERWEFKGHTYTFYLRPEMRFHNGRAVTPEDLEFSFAHYLGDKSPFASTLKIIEAVKVTEEKGQIVVKLTLQNNSDKFLVSDLPSIKILPKAEIQQMGSDFSQRLIGTGPYKFIKTDLNEIRLESFRAATKFLKFKIVRDDFTRFQKLLKGEVDFVQADMPTEKIVEFEKRPKEFQVFRYPGLTMTYLLINFRDPRLKQREVREALALSLKRDDIIQFKLNGFAREATSILTPNNPYFNTDLKNLGTDLQAARKIIEKLELQGAKLILKTSNTPQAIDNGKVLSNQLSQSGLNVDLESYEWGTFYQDVKRGNFQLASMRWVGTVDPDIYRMAFHSRELPPGRNRGAYSNPTLDPLLDQAGREEDTARRRALFLRVQKIVHDDLSILPLWYDEQVAIARYNVLNFKPSLTSDFLPLAKVEKREP